MAVYTQRKRQTGTGTSLTATFASTPAAGHLILAIVYGSSSTQLTSAKWNNAGSTLTALFSGSNGSGMILAAFTVESNGTINSITAAFSASQTDAEIDLYDFPGYVSGSLDVAAVVANATATSAACGPVTPTHGGVAVAIVGLNAGSFGGTPTWTSGWDGSGATSTGRMSSAVKASTAATSTGTATATWTTSRANRHYMVTFQTDTTAPSVSITSPTAGASESGTITVAATATDDVGVSSVVLKVDGTIVGAFTPGGGSSYSYSLDTTALGDGSHTLTATATDADGNSATSTDVSITTANSAPSVPSHLYLGSTNIKKRYVGASQINKRYVGSLLIIGEGSTPPPATPVVASAVYSDDQPSQFHLNVAVPSGVVSGSLVVAKVVVGWQNTTTPTDASIAPLPTGWFYGYGAAVTDAPDGAVAWVGYYYHYATGPETTPYDFEATGDGGTAPFEMFSISARITGGPTSGNPFVDSLHMSGSGSQPNGSPAVAAFTPPADNTLFLGGLDSFSPLSGLSGPSGWTEQAGSTSDNSTLYTLEQTAAAATGSLAFGVASDTCWSSVASIRA